MFGFYVAFSDQGGVGYSGILQFCHSHWQKIL